MDLDQNGVVVWLMVLLVFTYLAIVSSTLYFAAVVPLAAFCLAYASAYLKERARQKQQVAQQRRCLDYVRRMIEQREAFSDQVYALVMEQLLLGDMVAASFVADIDKYRQLRTGGRVEPEVELGELRERILVQLAQPGGDDED